MKLVAADPEGFTEVVATQSGVDNTLFLAHADGSISWYDKHQQLLRVWLNPGKRVSCMSLFDNDLFIGFTDATARVVSLETGLTVSSLELPTAFTGAAVFEHIVAGWSRYQTHVCLMYRFNFEIIDTIHADSFVASVIAVAGKISVVTSTGVYWLQQPAHAKQLAPASSKWELEPIFETSDYFILDACSFNKKWFILTPDSWKLLEQDPNSTTLKVHIEVGPPLETRFRAVSSVQNAVIIQCTKQKYVFVQQNNIQLMDSPLEGPQEDHPKEFLTPGASRIVTSHLQLFQAISLVSGELQWQQLQLPLPRVSTKYLPLQTDPLITAVHEFTGHKLIGTEDGAINGVCVFPEAVLSIDDTKAYSRSYEVTVPLKRLNRIEPATKLAEDERVSVPLSDLQWQQSKWFGVIDKHGISVIPAVYESVPLYISALLVHEGRMMMERALNIADTAPKSVSALEGLAVIALEAGEIALLKVVAKMLELVWNAERIESLLRAAGPHSLKVLVSVSCFLEIDEKRVVKTVKTLAKHRDIVSCDTVLWVYEREYKGVRGSSVPFESMQNITESMLRRFASNMALQEGGVARLLDDIRAVLSDSTRPDSLGVVSGSYSSSSSSIASTNTTATNAATTNNTNTHSRSENGTTTAAQQRSAINLLVALLNLSPPAPHVPQSESDLVRIVEIVVLAIHKHIPNAKLALSRLLKMQLIQFQKEKQRLLVPTSESYDQIALVYEIDRDVKDGKIRLQRPAEQSQYADSQPILGFSADGKAVNGIVGRDKYIWTLNRGFASFFHSNEQPIVPTKI